MSNPINPKSTERRAHILQTSAQVTNAVSTILDPDELTTTVVEEIRERFDLYYAGIFLVDDAGEWAILKAGSGEPGQKMLAENWKFAVGNDSMVGRCVATGKAAIQLDVDPAPGHLRNPHLPETRSAMALPLISRDEILGAITLQHAENDAYHDEDIAVFQILADQIANAISNARLFEALAREQHFMQSLMDNLHDPVYFKDRESRFIRINQSVADVEGFDKPEDLLGLTDFDIAPKEHAEKAFADEQRIMETRQPMLDMEEHVTYEDGSEIWTITSKFPLIDENNEVVGTFGISRWVTESKLLERTIKRRDEQIMTAAEIARAASSITDPEVLIQESVDLVKERFNLYYAGIFLVDESKKWAVLQGGTGEAGEQMMNENWKLEVGGSSMIGRCILTGKPDVQLNVDQAPVHLRNPHLPETRSEMALPLTSRGETLGALTIQSTAADAFTEEDTAVLLTMAGQLATALANAQLLEQTSTALEEIQNIQRRYEIQAWSEYNQRRPASGYRQTRGALTPLKTDLLPETKQTVSESQPKITNTPDNESLLTIPVMLRDQPIGALGIKSKQQEKQWSKQEITLIQNIAEQFAIAAESLRLLDETQRRAARERLVTEIATKIRATNDPQAMLQTAVSELKNALTAQRVQVIIQSGSDAPESQEPAAEENTP